MRSGCYTAIGYPHQMLNGAIVFLGTPPAQAIQNAVVLIPDDLDTFLVTDLNDVTGLKAALSGEQWADLVQFKNDTIKARKRELTGATPGIHEDFIETCKALLNDSKALTKNNLQDWLDAANALDAAYPDQEE